MPAAHGLHSGRKEAPRFWAKEERHLSARHTQVAGISFSMELGGYGGCFKLYYWDNDNMAQYGTKWFM